MRNTAQYILKRLLYMIPMVLVITFLIYGGLELTPGDAISHMIPPDQLANVNPEQLEALRESYGLNDPFLLRYVRWLGELLHGNFGYSITSGVPIKDILLQLFPATLELSLAALAISSVLGSILGILSALKKGSIGDNVLTVFGMIGVSIPQFFFGMLCILVFALDWAILPIGGRMAPGETGIWNHFKYLILPASVLGISLTAGVMRYSRSSMLDTMNKDYIKTARAKGLPEWRVNLVHGFRVALTPVVVLIGFRLPTLIGGSVVIETIRILCRIVRELGGIDQSKVFVNGASQGGGLGLACAALNPGLVNRAAILYPFLSDYRLVWELGADLIAYEGLRYYSRWFDPDGTRQDEWFAKLGYIDSKNFAHLVRCPVLFGTGLADEVCPPATQCAVYNNLNCPKRRYLFEGYGHEEIQDFDDLILDFFGREAAEL